MGNRHYSHRLAAFIATTLVFITTVLVSAAPPQNRIISLSGDLDFGWIPLRTSAQRTLTISNAGNSLLTISNLDYPALPASVQINFQGNFSAPIAPGHSKNVVITFTPLGTALNGGTNGLSFLGYLFVDSDATGGTNSILMSGVGTWPPATRILSLASNLDFESTPIGGFREMVLSLTNTGTMPLTVSNVTFPDGFGCFPTPLTISPGGMTNLYVWFAPNIVTNYGGIATVISDSTEPDLMLVTDGGNATNSLLGRSQFAVSGTGTYPAGKFIGLFMPTNNPKFENSGYFTATSTDKGILRATITLAGKRYPFTERISPSGAVSATITRKNLPNLNVSLQFPGGMYGWSWTGTIDDGAWIAPLTSVQTPPISRYPRRAVQSAKYTFSIAGSTNASVGPTTTGTGNLEIKVSNAVRLYGFLGDGTRYAQNATLCRSYIPFYIPLYANRGAVLGWLTFRYILPPPTEITLPIVEIPRQTNPPVFPPLSTIPVTIVGPTNLSPGISPPTNSPIEIIPHRTTELQLQIVGTLNWFKPAGTDRNYPDGFSFQTTVSGSVP